MIKINKIDYKEIFDAWKLSFNPSEIQEELAQKRLNVCMGCDFRKEVLKGIKWSAYCNDCGCPLNKKVFSKYFNPCTQKKWKEVDSDYITPPNKKNNDTLI
jgi:hypothetical protein